MLGCRIVVPIVPGDYADLELRPVGRLSCTVIEAAALKNTVTVGTSDPLALVWVRPLFKNATKPAMNTLNPVRMCTPTILLSARRKKVKVENVATVSLCWRHESHPS